MMFALNGTYVIFLALFLIFVYLLNEIMLKPVGQAMAKRQSKLNGDLDAAKTATQEAQKLLADYQAKLHESRVQAQTIIQDALNTVQKERDEKLKLIQEQGRSKIESLKNELAGERQNLLRSLIHPELELVGQIISKLLGEQVPSLATTDERVLQTLESIR